MKSLLAILCALLGVVSAQAASFVSPAGGSSGGGSATNAISTVSIAGSPIGNGLTAMNFTRGLTGYVSSATALVGWNGYSADTLTNGNLLIVDKVAGNDATGIRHSALFTFSTPKGAYNASLAGDTIVYLPGLHVTTNSLTKNLVDHFLYSGATLAMTNRLLTNGSGTARSLFDDLDGAATFNISGYGTLLYDCGTNVFNQSAMPPEPVAANSTIKGLFYLGNSNSQANVTIRRALIRNYVQVPAVPAAFYVANATNFTLNCDEILDLGYGQNLQIGVDDFSDPYYVGPNVTGLYWELGKWSSRVHSIKVSFYPIYLSQPAGNNHNAGFYHSGHTIENNTSGTTIYMAGAGTATNWTSWIELQEVKGTVALASWGPTAGKHYLKAMKLTGMITDSGGSGRILAWADIQKLSANVNSAVTMSTAVNSASVFDLNIGQIEDSTGNMTTALDVRRGLLKLKNTSIPVPNGIGLNLAIGGRAELKNVDIDTSATATIGNYPIVVATNGLKLYDVILTAPANSFSIQSASSNSVTWTSGLGNKDTTNIALIGGPITLGTTAIFPGSITVATNATVNDLQVNNNIGFLVGTVAGVGGANTNFTLQAANDESVIYLNAGTTNVNIVAIMGGSASVAYRGAVVLTNRTATSRVLSLGATTNNWISLQQYDGITAPFTITNSLAARMEWEILGTNVQYSFKPMALPSN